MRGRQSMRIGTAGWTIPRAVAAQFPPEGSSLQRYAAVFDAAEINSTFHRPHRQDTYRRWADSTPPDFRFAVKLAKTITHEARLSGVAGLLDAFAADAELLGERRGPLLVQLPPSLAFELEVADAFFEAVRERWTLGVACEPRHASWFEPDAEALLVQHQVARVAADPARHPTAGAPGGWSGLVYYRLHGAPRVYYSAYEEATLAELAAGLGDSQTETWCIFDNTASGAAAADALALVERLTAVALG